MAQNNQSLRRLDLIRLDPWFHHLLMRAAQPVLEPLILALTGARRINRAYREPAALPENTAVFEKCIQVLKTDLPVTARDRRRLPFPPVARHRRFHPGQPALPPLPGAA